nr:retrovirus-related Pol polyprotein from transposon TNT 1-94 [Tanacetum cinerariifolium]
MNANQLKALKEKRMKAKTALYLLFQSVDESGFEKIAGASTAKQAWDTLEKGYKGADRVKQVRLQTLRGELEAMRMKETEGVSDYITRVQTVVNKRKRNGETLPDTRIIEKILRSLTENFKNVVCAIEESKDMEDLTIEELAGSLEAHNKERTKRSKNPLMKHSKQRLQSRTKMSYFHIRITMGKEPILVGVILIVVEAVVENIITRKARKGANTSIKIYVAEDANVEEADKDTVQVWTAIIAFRPTYGERLLGTDEKWEIALKNKEGVIIALVKMCKNRTFKLNLSNVNEKCLKADLSDKESVWHLRFGHLHFSGLKELTRKNMVYGLPNLEYDGRFCESCIFRKQTRSSFPRKATYEAKELLELIHSDLCGPLSPVSFGNKKTTGKCIKALRLDRCGEYVSTPFTKFCEEEGIKRFLTAPYSPQQNGIAKRKNRTIMNTVRSMLKSKNMPKEFWAEAVQCADWSNECLYDPHNNTKHDARAVSIPTAVSDPTMVTTDSENDDEPIQPRMRSLQDIYNNTTEIHLARQAWNIRIDSFLKRMDDLIFTGNNKRMIDQFKESMTREFDMTDMGLMKYFLGLEYAHWKALKIILRYVKGTELLGLFYLSSKEYTLTGYSDSDWHGDVDDRKSTSGYVFFMGKTAFTWASKKLPIVALSTCEAEYVAASWTVCHAIWLRNLLRELKNQQEGPTEIKVDNKDVQLTHVMSRDQAADIFIKALQAELFNLCKQKMGMKDERDVSLREEFVGK